MLAEFFNTAHSLKLSMTSQYIYCCAAPYIYSSRANRSWGVDRWRYCRRLQKVSHVSSPVIYELIRAAIRARHFPASRVDSSQLDMRSWSVTSYIMQIWLARFKSTTTRLNHREGGWGGRVGRGGWGGRVGRGGEGRGGEGRGGEGRGGEGRGGEGGREGSEGARERGSEWGRERWREGGREGRARAKSPIRPPTLRNITSSNVER